MTKLKRKEKCDITETQNVAKLNNSKCNKTQKLKM